jgi:hypothetical protein
MYPLFTLQSQPDSLPPALSNQSINAFQLSSRTVRERGYERVGAWRDNKYSVYVTVSVCVRGAGALCLIQFYSVNQNLNTPQWQSQ